MRKIEFKKIGLAAMMILSALTFQSCDTDNDTDWDRVFPNALVTAVSYTHLTLPTML